MGLLSLGQPLDWVETNKYAKYVQERGIAQFINVYNKSKDRADGPFKWGDEVEYILVKFDHQNKTARVSLKAEEVFRRLDDQQKSRPGPTLSFWNPEFASYMVEGTPGVPYGVDGLLLSNLCYVEESMKLRREEVQRVLEPDETIMTLTSFPRLGCPNFTHPICSPRPESSASGSIFFPDEAIYGGHPRFKTLVKNIRSRRRRKVIINIPIFKDINTQDPFIENFIDEEARRASKPDHVYMDAMGFGMGCSCLQITFQATHLEEAKNLYDQLAPITPIALALSAASPVFRGYLVDRDCRWNIIACSVDDRTLEESSETSEMKDSKYRIPKSRYDSISTYLSKKGQQFNDLPLVYDKRYYDMMISSNVDHAIAQHIAHLFIRDPVTLYKEKLEQSDEEMDHFENIQSTNWQTLRFKPPPYAHSPIGWRVEFRPFEAQLTDFENAALVVFVTLLTRVILAYKLNFLIPISLVDENMIEAQKRNSIKESKFWFRRDIMRKSSCKEPLSTVLENLPTNSCNGFGLRGFSNQVNVSSTPPGRVDYNESRDPHIDVALMTVNEVINGCEGFVGIMPIICHYVDSFDDGSNSGIISKIHKYLKLVSDRASLKVKTTARMIRDYIDSHPKYTHDSQVNDDVAYDLLHTMDKIGKGELVCPELLGNQQTDSMDTHVGSCCTRRTPRSNGHSSHSSDHGSSTSGRKSCALFNSFCSSRKSPSSRVTKQSTDKNINGRSMSR